MKIIIAPDSFKGSLSGQQAAEAMRQAIGKVFPKAECVVLPISDGGEGAAQVLASALSGRFCQKQVCGPYEKRVQASYYLAKSGMGIVELAEAAGLTLASQKERRPLYSTTFGVGELLIDAVSNGAAKLCLRSSPIVQGWRSLRRSTPLLCARNFAKSRSSLPAM